MSSFRPLFIIKNKTVIEINGSGVCQTDEVVISFFAYCRNMRINYISTTILMKLLLTSIIKYYLLKNILLFCINKLNNNSEFW